MILVGVALEVGCSNLKGGEGKEVATFALEEGRVTVKQEDRT